MSSQSDLCTLDSDLSQLLEDEVVGQFREVQRLTREVSPLDPDEDPYRSLYAARELLCEIRSQLEKFPPRVRDTEDYLVVRACVQLHLGLSYTSTEEMGSGEEQFGECVRGLEGVASKVKTASISLQAYNQLGVLWGNRGEQQKALESLLKAKAVYDSHVALPPPMTDSQFLCGQEESEYEREKAFEGMHTHTLFYLAQVFGNLNQPKQAAQYCQQTLSRQLETHEFDSLEWSVSCATLSQYYLNAEHFVQARHCLAAAGHVLDQFTPDRKELQEKVIQSRGDISRCWTKYCIAILRSSRDKMEGTSATDDHPRQKLFKFDTLEVVGAELEVTVDLVENFEGGKRVFLFAQEQVKLSKQFYSLEELASGYIEVVQDHSLLYKLLAYFESDDTLKCRLHKRRVDMLAATLAELNPQHYLMACRQLMFELAEAHSEMAGLKTVLASESPSPHAVAKINRLVRSSIDHFQRFVDSFKEGQTGELPADIEEDFLRPILSAQLSTARLYTQLITPSTAEQVHTTPVPHLPTSVWQEVLWLPVFVNPRRACTVRVTVVVPCVCIRSNLLPHTLESQKRNTNGFIAIQEPF